jgi:hypothetical protein
MKPSRERIAAIVGALSEVVPFFPQKPLALDLITEAVLEFVGTDEQLEWFARAAIRNLPKYEGVPQLRALFCTKYAPADGLPAVVEIAGHTEEELEARFRQREIAENQRRHDEYLRQARLAPAEDRAPFQLPELKQIPPPHNPDTPPTPIRTEEERLKIVQDVQKSLDPPPDSEN